MPLTPSHAVVALAFLRTPVAPATVAIGAMTPDFPLFLRGTPLHYATTHSWTGLPITVLLALVLLLLWRGILRPGTRELSPRWLATRLPPEWDVGLTAGIRESFAVRGSSVASAAGGALLLLGLLIGVVSHVLWDPFTHQGRWGTVFVPALADDWGPLPGYTWLQHGCSALGLLVLAIAGWLWLRKQAAAPVVRVFPEWVRVTCWLALPAMLALASAVALALDGPLRPEFTLAHLAYRTFLPVIAAWGVAIVAIAVAVPPLRRDTPGMHR